MGDIPYSETDQITTSQQISTPLPNKKPGEIPNMVLNDVLKWAESEKPASSAASVKLAPFATACATCAMRRQSRYRRKGNPTSWANKALKRELDRQASFAASSIELNRAGRASISSSTCLIFEDDSGRLLRGKHPSMSFRDKLALSISHNAFRACNKAVGVQGSNRGQCRPLWKGQSTVSFSQALFKSLSARVQAQ